LCLCLDCRIDALCLCLRCRLVPSLCALWLCLDSCLYSDRFMSMLDLPSLCSAHARACSCNPQNVSQELLDLEVKLRVAIIKSEISKRSNALELVRLFTRSCQAQFNPAKPDAGLLHAPALYPTMPPRSSCRNHHPRELCQGRI